MLSNDNQTSKDKRRIPYGYRWEDIFFSCPPPTPFFYFQGNGRRAIEACVGHSVCQRLQNDDNSRESIPLTSSHLLILHLQLTFPRALTRITWSGNILFADVKACACKRLCCIHKNERTNERKKERKKKIGWWFRSRLKLVRFRPVIDPRSDLIQAQIWSKSDLFREIKMGKGVLQLLSVAHSFQYITRLFWY